MADMGDILNHLSEHSADKSREMIPVINRISGVEKQFGLDFKQAIVLANALNSLGVPVSKSGTTAVSLPNELQTAEQQNEEFQEALEEIGTSAKEMKQGIKYDPQGTLLKFLKLIEKVHPLERSGILVKLFGKQFQDEIALLVGSLEKYEEAIGHVAKAEKYKGSMQREFYNRASTTANKLQLLKNSIAEVGMNLGSVMLPALKSIAE